MTSCSSAKALIDIPVIFDFSNVFPKGLPDLPLETVVSALKIWRHYLYGVKFIIYTDHKSLKYVFDQRALITRQTRWLEVVKDYNCEIHYHPSEANAIADALSRKQSAESI